MNIKYESNNDSDIEDLKRYINDKIKECEPEVTEKAETNNNTTDQPKNNNQCPINIDDMLKKINENNNTIITKLQVENNKVVTDLIKQQKIDNDMKNEELVKNVGDNFTAAFQEYKQEVEVLIDHKIDKKIDDFVSDELNPKIMEIDSRIKNNEDNVTKLKNAMLVLFTNSDLVNVRNTDDKCKLIEKALSEASLDSLIKATKVTKPRAARKTKLTGDRTSNTVYNRRIKLVDNSGKPVLPSPIPNGTPTNVTTTKSQILAVVAQSDPGRKSKIIGNSNNNNSTPIASNQVVNYMKATTSSKNKETYKNSIDSSNQSHYTEEVEESNQTQSQLGGNESNVTVDMRTSDSSKFAGLQLQDDSFSPPLNTNFAELTPIDYSQQLFFNQNMYLNQLNSNQANINQYQSTQYFPSGLNFEAGGSNHAN
jgi:hypothetical protein